MREYTLASAGTGRFLHKAGKGVTSKAAAAASINEVGLTDVAMASLWTHAEAGTTYAVTSKAEANVLGGDLAVLDGAGTLRIYQAKLVKDLDAVSGEYVLKSALAVAHTLLLNSGTFNWDGRRFHMNGYLALYQQHLGVVHGTRKPHRSVWWTATANSVNAPALGARYYWDMMRPTPMASARGIMAAPVPPLPASTAVDRVPIHNSWPWEYSIANTWTGPAGGPPTDDADGEPAQRNPGDAPPPLAEAGDLSPRSEEQRADFASRLFDRLYEDRPASLTVAFV
ncbi:hypothetical protein GCM10028801_28760 [Nocardioides maradonensis]